jgi:beta-lactamase regulating signal transducer with metallopeptidase domain
MNLQTLGIETLSILWRANWQAGVLILTVLALRLLLGRHLSAQWRCRLWMLVMLRLMLPVIPTSPWSVFNLFHAPEPAASVSHEIELPAKVIFIDASESSPAATPETVRKPIDWNAILIAAWLSGILTLGLWFILANIRFARRIRSSTAALSGEMIQLFQACARELRITRVPEILVSEAISTASLYGLIRRRLLLPKGYCTNLSPAEARLVFLHELAHICRNDLPTAWIAALLRIIHWFNPLVWIAIKMWRTDMESACDDAVLAMTEPIDHARYGLILLKLATQSIASTPLPALGIIGGRMQLRRRIIAISGFRRPTAQWSIAAAVILGLTLLLGLTDARGGSPSTQTTVPSDLVTRVYKIAELVTTTQPTQTIPDPTDDEGRLLPPMPMFRITPEEIANWMRQSVAPGAENQEVRIDTDGNTLFVTAPLETQKIISDSLHAATKSRRVQINIMTRFLTPDPHALAGLKGAPTHTAVPGELKFVTPEEVDRLIRTAPKISHAPHAIVWSMQTCEMYQITYTPYVAGVRSQKVNGQLVSVPIIQQAKDGVAMAFQPVVTSDRQFVTLALVIKQLNLFGFTTETELRGKNSVKWQSPNQFDTEVCARIQVPAGLSVLVPLRKDDYAIVTPKIVP